MTHYQVNTMTMFASSIEPLTLVTPKGIWVPLPERVSNLTLTSVDVQLTNSHAHFDFVHHFISKRSIYTIKINRRRGFPGAFMLMM